MPKVVFDDVEFLRKQTATLQGFKKVCDFVNELVDKYNDTDIRYLDNKKIGFEPNFYFRKFPILSILFNETAISTCGHTNTDLFSINNDCT